MDRAERVLLEATTHAALTHAPANADAVLAELGWLDMLQAEPPDAIGIVFTAVGRTNTTASVLDDVLSSALGATPDPALAVVLPPFGVWDPPGRADGEHVRAAGLATTRVATAEAVLVVCATGSGLGVVNVPSFAVEAHAIRGIDPAAGFRNTRVEHRATITPVEPDAWNAAIALGRRAIAHEIAGATRAMLDAARTHALEREQFDRPIARFQAVRHRLAETLIAIEALEAALGAAADVPNPLTAALAKATAGRTARIVASHCQQVLAGIGFTTDHPFHGYLKRTMLLDGLFGSADDITVDIGRHLLAQRRVPTLIEL